MDKPKYTQKQWDEKQNEIKRLKNRDTLMKLGINGDTAALIDKIERKDEFIIEMIKDMRWAFESWKNSEDGTIDDECIHNMQVHIAGSRNILEG